MPMIGRRSSCVAERTELRGFALVRAIATIILCRL
jgi:hypothetical protein